MVVFIFMALKRIDWIMWMSLSLGFFLCLCAKLQLFEHICTYMQVYIIFNNFHPFAVLMLLLCICSLSTNVCFYLCLYANIFNNTHEKKTHLVTFLLFISYLLFWCIITIFIISLSLRVRSMNGTGRWVRIWNRRVWPSTGMGILLTKANA